MRKRLLKHWPLVLAGLLALLCVFCIWRLHSVSRLLTSQQAAERVLLLHRIHSLSFFP